MSIDKNQLLDATQFNCETAKIMIIDDDPATTELVEAYLEENGFQNVCSLNDALLGLESIKKFDPDLVLLDIMMPQLNGLDLLQQIRSDRAHDDLVVLMFSAAGKNLKYKALRLGAVDFVDKPVDADQLGDKVRNALRIL